MLAHEYRWSEIEEDQPIPLLYRKKIAGENMLVARIRLERGCHVKSHCHPREQISLILSGLVRWTIGEEGSADRYTREMSAGDVLVIPSGVYHELHTLEDMEGIDILSPPGEMGVDRQGK
jgi:quercetin dioxygenase-like cupin family protein